MRFNLNIQNIKMEINIFYEDHSKEYFYKISKNGNKLYYRRTSEGNKKIAKSKIPIHFIEQIKEYDPEKDFDWMRQKRLALKKAETYKNNRR